LSGQINYLNFENEETIRNTQIIGTTRSTVAKLFVDVLYIFYANNNILTSVQIMNFVGPNKYLAEGDGVI
jgi:hypothetical protein